MADTMSAVVMTVFGSAITVYGVLLMIFAITGKGLAKGLKPEHRARQGISAFMIIVIGIWLASLGFTE